jgi:putative nucleotidyltransferase with HDIG domain
VTASRPVERVRRFSGLPSRDRALLFGLTVSWLVFGALYPVFPGVRRLEVGATAPGELRAPRSASYISEVLTRQRREAASAAVGEVSVLDATVRTTQLAALDRRLERIDVVRRDVTLSPAARIASIGAAAEGRLSEGSAALLATSPDATWQLIAAQARTTLSRVLSGSIAEVDVEEQRARLSSPEAGEGGEHASAVAELLAPLVVPTVVVDRGRTNALRAEAMAAVAPVAITVPQGDIAVSAGAVLNAADIERLDALGLRSSAVDFSTLAAAALFGVLIGALWGGSLTTLGPALEGLRRPLLAALLVAVPLLVARLGLPRLLPDEAGYFLAYAMPLAAAPMLAAALLDAGVALLVTLTIALGVALLTGYLPPENGTLDSTEALRLVVAVAASSVAGTLLALRAEGVARFLRAGAGSAAAAYGVVLVFWLLQPSSAPIEAGRGLAAVLAGGVLSAFLVAALFALLSAAFGIVTRAQLMELAQLNHPLLRRLQDEAPGTFQHAVLVGNLAERAADRIGADALLVRVGAYYHDVGKLIAPAFFVENVHPEASPHEGLDPLQSTRVIHQHVTAGMDLARREGLPAAVARFIPEHHGTRLMTFFYRRAAEEDPDIEPELFRYPGPRPRSRESALVMLADACEATVRASLDRAEDRIRSIVEGIVRERIEEGQFEDCDISLHDLAVVSDSFTRSLSAVYHPRVQYPEPTLRELDARRVEPLPPPPSARTAGSTPASSSTPAALPPGTPEGGH